MGYRLYYLMEYLGEFPTRDAAMSEAVSLSEERGMSLEDFEVLDKSDA